MLKRALDYFIPTSSVKPTLDYEFVNEVINYYDNLQQYYKAETEMEVVENQDWRNFSNFFSSFVEHFVS